MKITHVFLFSLLASFALFLSGCNKDKEEAESPTQNIPNNWGYVLVDQDTLHTHARAVLYRPTENPEDALLFLLNPHTVPSFNEGLGVEINGEAGKPMALSAFNILLSAEAETLLEGEYPFGYSLQNCYSAGALRAEDNYLDEGNYVQYMLIDVDAPLNENVLHIRKLDGGFEVSCEGTALDEQGNAHTLKVFWRGQVELAE